MIVTATLFFFKTKDLNGVDRTKTNNPKGFNKFEKNFHALTH